MKFIAWEVIYVLQHISWPGAFVLSVFIICLTAVIVL